MKTKLKHLKAHQYVNFQTRKKHARRQKTIQKTSLKDYKQNFGYGFRCYVAADVDMDGKVDGSEFSGMIEVQYSILRIFHNILLEEFKRSLSEVR